MSLPREAREGVERAFLQILRDRHPGTDWVIVKPPPKVRDMTRPFDPYCDRYPDQIPEYVEAGADNEMTADEYVLDQEGTYNPANGHFACTSCYIKLGMPTSPSGWCAP